MTQRAMRLTLIAAACLAHCAAQAQVATDASLGQAAKSLTGPAYQIPQTLGKLAGSNLFHSFQVFNIGSGESANFSTTTPGIVNVVSRVTGGAPSSINGQINYTAADGRPSFYFINPAGVTFGKGAAIDVPGAFHVSTADTLRFADGGVLNADPAKASSFSSAAPEAFGFLGASRATIAVQDGAALVTRVGRPLSVVAGDVLVDNGTLGTFAADLRVAAVGKTALTLNVAGPLPALTGYVSLSNDSTLQVSNYLDSASGNLLLGGGDIDVNFSSILSRARADASGAGGDLRISASGLLFIDEQSTIQSVALGAGKGGAIDIRAHDVGLFGGSDITTGAEAGGQGGALSIQALDRLIVSGGKVQSYTFSGAQGGALALSGQVLTLNNGAVLTSETDASGKGGDLSVAAGGALALAGSTVKTVGFDSGDAGALSLSGSSVALGSKALVTSVAQGGGQSGTISVATPGSLNLAGESSIINVTSARASGLGIQLNAGAIDVTGNSQLTSSGLGLGALGGDIDIKSSGNLKLSDGGRIVTYGVEQGSGGQTTVVAKDIGIVGGGALNSNITSGSSDGTSTAGKIDLTASGTLSLTNGGYLSSGTFGNASSGLIRLSAQDLLLQKAQISNSAYNGLGNGGDVEITVRGAMDLRDGSSINSATGAKGNAGNMRIAAANLTMSGTSSMFNSATAAATGRAGVIDIKVPGKVTLTSGSFIDSSTQSSGNAGAVKITAGDVLLSGGGSVLNSAAQGSTGNAGTIEFDVARQLVMDASSGLIYNSSSGTGDAGSIKIRANQFLMGGGSIRSEAAPGSAGNAGSVDIQALDKLEVTHGLISSSSTAGRGGNVALGAKTIDLSGPASFVSATVYEGSGGQTGNVDLVASESIRISDGAAVLMQNRASVANPAALTPTRIRMAAALIVMDASDVSVDAFGNASASAVQIDTDVLRLSHSEISTSANLGNGGPITIQGNKLIALDNALITTSVFGATGNGGDICITGDALVLNSGFIQANTAAANASGGLVNINTKSLVASGSTLFAGGPEPIVPVAGVFGLNVIQAAAPTGISGTISINSPVLDVSGSLRGLNAQALDTGGLGRDPCQTTAGSSLVQAGRGGMPANARGLLGPAASVSVALDTPPLLASLAPGGCR